MVDDQQLTLVTHSSTSLFIFAMVGITALIALFFLAGWWIYNRDHQTTPYGTGPLCRGTDLSFSALEQLHKFTLQEGQQPIQLEKASVCLQTGRVFPHTINRRKVIRTGWAFLPKGEWIHWGALTDEEKTIIGETHSTLEGFQTLHAPTEPSPKRVPRAFTLVKPGPLYVNLSTKELIGWKCVPGTDLEILVSMQKQPS
jgi:hypothetical protein